MDVTFASFGDHIASSRLRAIIPQKELAKYGVKQGFDALVYGKHIITKKQTRRFKKRIFDICDDHFQNEYLGDYYRSHCEDADAITCNSDTMARIIKTHTGRDSTVIPDPYEAPEKPAGVGDGYLWFGHETNLPDVEPYAWITKYQTGAEWTLEGQRKAIQSCAAVVIPTNLNRPAKSANRLIEAVRNGRFVIAGYLPAYHEFSPYMYIGDIEEGRGWFERHTEEAIKRVRNCQDYIRERYSPETIAKQWLEVLERVCQ